MSPSFDENSVFTRMEKIRIDAACRRLISLHAKAGTFPPNESHHYAIFCPVTGGKQSLERPRHGNKRPRDAVQYAILSCRDKCDEKTLLLR